MLEGISQGIAFCIEARVLQQRGIVRLGNHRTKIAQIDGVEDFFHCIHAVLPFGNAQSWEQLHYEVHQRISIDLGLTSLDELVVLLVHGAAHRTDAAFECLFGQDAFFGLQRLEYGLAMNVERTQACCTRTLRQFWWGRCEFAAWGAWGPWGSGLRTCTTSRSALVATRALAVLAATITLGATIRGDFGDRLELCSGSGDCQERDVALTLLDRRHSENDRTVHVHFDVGAQHIADLCVAGQQVGRT